MCFGISSIVITISLVNGGWTLQPSVQAAPQVWARGADAYDAAIALAKDHQQRGMPVQVRVAALGGSVDVLSLGSAERHGLAASAPPSVSLAPAS